MKRKKLCVTTALLITLAVALSGCSAASAPVKSGSGTLRVGVRDDIMNFGFQNKDTGRYYGMEIDLSNLLAEKMGYADVEFVTVQPETRKDMLLNGEVDCMVAAYSIVESRLKNFDFSAPYYGDDIKVMVEKSTGFEHMADLKGKTVGVLAGVSAPFEFAEEMADLGLLTEAEKTPTEADPYGAGVTFWKAEQYSDLAAALEDGTVDAICMDGCIAQAYLTDDRRFLAETFAEQDYGVATQKGSALSKPVADAIQAMLDDGTIETLIDKWN